MGLLDRNKLLEKEELKIEKVELEKGNFVFVRQMTGRERNRWEISIVKRVQLGKTITYEQNLEDFRSKLAVKTVCDKDGKLILKPEDYVALAQNMSAFTLEKIVNKAQELNKITDDDKEDLVKNSGAVQSGDSTSGSAQS